MKLIIKSVTLILMVLVFANSYATTGRFVGEINKSAIDVEVKCDIDKPNYFSIRSDQGMSGEKDYNKDGIVINIGAMNMNGMMMSAIINIDGEKYKFGTRKFQRKDGVISYSGSLNSKKRGEYQVDFVITCDGK